MISVILPRHSTKAGADTHNRHGTGRRFSGALFQLYKTMVVNQMVKFEYMERMFSSGLRPRARLVFQILVLHCNREGECFPAIRTIAAKCGCGISTVKRALDELVKAGYITKEARFDEGRNGGQTSNLYTLCTEVSEQPKLTQPEQPAKPDNVAAAEEIQRQGDGLLSTPDFTHGEKSAHLPLPAYTFIRIHKMILGRIWRGPDAVWTGGQSIFVPP